MLLAALTALLAAAGAAAPARVAPENVVTAKVIEVSKKGMSLTKAFKKLAEYRVNEPETPVDIVIGEGGYALKESFLLSTFDANPKVGKLTIRAAKGATPTILGSVPVKGWTRTKTRFNGRSDVWECDISGLGLTEQLPALFMDKKMLTLARYPNFNPKYPFAGGWAYVPGRWISMYQFPEHEPAGTRDFMKIGEKDWHNWAVPEEGRILIFPRQRFGCSYVPIADFDREKKQIMFANRLCDVPRPGDTYVLSGYREELDVPGEWCHDLKGKKLYLIPPKGKSPNASVITVPLASTVFEFKDCSNVTIEGLEFCAAKRVAVMRGGRDVKFVGCKIHDISSRAVEMLYVKGCEIRDCDIYDLGREFLHGIGFGRPNRDPSITVENCWIHHVGQTTVAADAIFFEGNGFRIRHNLMHDLPHWGVFLSGNFTEFTDNRIHHYMLGTEDGAAFYTCNYMGGVGSTYARNWISDGVGFAKCAGWGPLAFFQNSHGFYFDAGPGGVTIYDNVLERISGMCLKMDSTRANVVSNNVMYMCGNPGLIHWSFNMNLSASPYDRKKGDGEYHGALRGDPSLKELPCFRYAPSQSPAAHHGSSWGNVLVHNVWHYPHCPRSLYVLLQGADITAQTIDWNIINPGKDAEWPNLNGVAWKEGWVKGFGADVHSKVVHHLNFRDPKKGDFTLKEKAMADKMGIHPVNLKNCGLYVTKFRPKIEKEPDGAANHPEWFRNPIDHVNPPPEKKATAKTGKKPKEGKK